MAMTLTRNRKNERAEPSLPLYYPTSDGQPMAETDLHVSLIAYHLSALRRFLATHEQTAYVAGNNFLYYREGDPKARVSPDTYVVLGADPALRRSYKVWEEDGRLPSVVFEFTSRKTQGEDLGKKFTLYEQTLKVAEYFLFDPTGEYLSPRLQGYRLHNGRYVPIPLIDGRMTSEQLALELVVEGDWLRLFDPAAGRFLPTLDEAETQREQAEAQLQSADAEIARLRAEIAALRGEN